jgi:hypothetical protein
VSSPSPLAFFCFNFVGLEYLRQIFKIAFTARLAFCPTLEADNRFKSVAGDSALR